METQVETTPKKSDELVLSPQTTFNFEVWIKHVRPQLLASVQKRGVK
jgi:hypothetical protein